MVVSVCSGVKVTSPGEVNERGRLSLDVRVWVLSILQKLREKSERKKYAQDA